jgi:5'-nucleotidase
MKLLLTNDDGIDAPGLAALGRAVAGMGEVLVVAPAAAHSGCSHRVTTHEPIHVERRSPRSFAVHGTPADCVRVSLARLAPDAEWVLAGVNAGGNLGADVWHSGTVAAVREAVLHGRPGIAVSHYMRRGVPVDWERAAARVAPVLRDLLRQPWRPGTLWNINLPHLDPDAPAPEVVRCRVDPGPLPLAYRDDGDGNILIYDGNYHQRRREPGADVDVCFGGRIAVSRIDLF